MMMALVSLMTLSAQAQANFEVSVSNPSKSAKTDAPVVIDLSKLGSIGAIQRAVVKVDGKEIPSQLDDTNRDCTNDELCFLVDLGKKETKTYQVQLYQDGEQAQYPARTFAELCLPSKNKKLAKNKQDIYLRSISFDKKTKECITTCILMASASRVNWLPCVYISTIARPSTSMARLTRDWLSMIPSSIHPKNSSRLVLATTAFG